MEDGEVGRDTGWHISAALPVPVTLLSLYERRTIYERLAVAEPLHRFSGLQWF
jgi:hypothetical protein